MVSADVVTTARRVSRASVVWRARGLALASLLMLSAGCGWTAPPLADVHAAATTALWQGHLDEALALTDEGIERAPGDDAWGPAFQLLRAEVLLLKRAPDEATALLDGPLARPDLAPSLIARRRMLEGQALMVRGQMSDAVSVLQDAARRAEAAGAVDVWLDTDALLGQALLRTGQWDTAEALLVTARERARGANDAAREAAVLLNLGMSRLVRARYDEALQYFEAILDLTAAEDHLVYAAALSNAGICHARLGAFDQAASRQARAVAVHERRGVEAYLEQALGELGNTEVLRGRPEEALPHLLRAQTVAAEAGLTADAALWAGNLAAVHVELGRWDEAAEYNAEAVRLKQEADSPTLVYNTLNDARIAAGRGLTDVALASFAEALATPDVPAAVEWEAHAGMATVLRATGNDTDAQRHYADALAIIERARADLLRPESRITFLSRLIRFHQDYVDLLVDLGEPGRALEVADESRARELAQGHGVSAIGPARVADFQRTARAAGSTLLAYWVAGARSFAWVITPERLEIVELPGAEVITERVVAYRAMVETSVADPMAAGATIADALTDAVLAPVLEHIPAGSRVIVVPDGPLHGVNLEALPVASPRRYWIEDVTLSVAPSLGIVASAEAPVPADSPAMLLIGDPASTELPALQMASEELDAIRRAFPDVPTEEYRGATATPDVYAASDPGRFAIIHFAAHATITAASPLESAIELAPVSGRHKLYAREVAARPLRATLVTISACRSAGDRAYSGEGLVGFAWAFLRAGARRVVAGLWDVDDRSTALLMDGLYTGLAAGDQPSSALRQAKLDLIRAGGNFAKPYYWAPFQVFRASR